MLFKLEDHRYESDDRYSHRLHIQLLYAFRVRLIRVSHSDEVVLLGLNSQFLGQDYNAQHNQSRYILGLC